MRIKQQAFILLAALMSVHLGVLTYASFGCISQGLENRGDLKQECENVGGRWEGVAETYLAVILALLVPTVDRDES